MPEFSYTVTPSITEDPVTGETTYNIMQADVQSSGQHQAIRDQHFQEQQENFREAEDGEYESHTDFSEEDAANLFEMVGGEEHYTNALQWAAENLDEEDIEYYDQAMANGNIAEIHDLMQQLVERYENAEDDGLDYASFESYLLDEVCSPEQFNEIKQYIRETRDEEFRDALNEVLDDGDYETYEEAIRFFMAELGMN